MKKFIMYLVFTILTIICLIPSLLVVIKTLVIRMADSMTNSLDEFHEWLNSDQKK